MSGGKATPPDLSEEGEEYFSARTVHEMIEKALAEQRKRLAEPDIVVTDTGQAWAYATNKHIKGTYYREVPAPDQEALGSTQPEVKP